MLDSKIFAILAFLHIPFMLMSISPTTVDEAMWSLLLTISFLACILMAIAGDDFHPA